MNPGGGRSSVFLRDSSSALPKVNIAPNVRANSVPSSPTYTRGSGLSPSFSPVVAPPGVIYTSSMHIVIKTDYFIFQIFDKVSYDDLQLAIESEVWKDDPVFFNWIVQQMGRLAAVGPYNQVFSRFLDIATKDWWDVLKEKYPSEVEKMVQNPPAVIQTMVSYISIHVQD